jgi:hypothetical protein
VVNDRGPVWRLWRGDELVADLVVTGGDFPWLQASLEATPAFESMRDLFAEELRLVDRLEEEYLAWEAVDEQIHTILSLENPEGVRVPEFLLHIEGEAAWWRWSDEPFVD